MFTHKDIEYRSIFVVNSLDNKKFRVQMGELLLLEVNSETKEEKTLTKFPFQKILALLIIGSATITTPLIEKCAQFGISLVVTKANLRPVFFWGNVAEANFLLRKKQYEYKKGDLLIPKILVENKINNQIKLLENTRLKNELMQAAKLRCRDLLEDLPQADTYERVMGIEGQVAAEFFSAYFEPLGWTRRAPRMKIDAVNTALDIGYTILFNWVEVFARIFGFDPYCGVYHQLWFKRKSLICDLMEPFRCLIDNQVRKSFNLGQFKEDDFDKKKIGFVLKLEKNAEYSRIFCEALVEHKSEFFKYVQQYYRAFMRCKSAEGYPKFLI